MSPTEFVVKTDILFIKKKKYLPQKLSKKDSNLTTNVVHTTLLEMIKR